MIDIKVSMDDSIQIIKEAGAWMKEFKPDSFNEWWDPEKVNSKMFKPYAKPEEFYVLYIDHEPAATAIIQQKQNMQDWSSVDGNTERQDAIYIHYVAVSRKFAGQGLVAKLIEKAREIAKKNQATVLRLDTNANESKLCQLYEGLGFVQVGKDKDGDHVSALYEKIF